MVVVRDGMVRASGGVVVRTRGSEPQILLVHRPRYDDWTIPKGKLDPGETDEECALREVEEETGQACTLGAELPSVSYVDRRGRPKLVRYWLMDPTPPIIEADTFEANDEADLIRWVNLIEARSLLSYARDVEVLFGRMSDT